MDIHSNYILKTDQMRSVYNISCARSSLDFMVRRGLIKGYHESDQFANWRIGIKKGWLQDTKMNKNNKISLKTYKNCDLACSKNCGYCISQKSVLYLMQNTICK